MLIQVLVCRSCCLVTEAAADPPSCWSRTQFPQHLWRWYCACVFPLMLLRWIIYKKNKWHYFMLVTSQPLPAVGAQCTAHHPRFVAPLCCQDYCYFTNLACLVYIYLLPAGYELCCCWLLLRTCCAYPAAPAPIPRIGASRWLFQLVFAASNGPLVRAPQSQPVQRFVNLFCRLLSCFVHCSQLWAIVAWNNSLVFHSLDKITSVFIHGLPAMLTYTLRWYYPFAHGLDTAD